MRRTGKSKTCVWRWQERFAEEGDRPDPKQDSPFEATVLDRRDDGQGRWRLGGLGATHLAGAWASTASRPIEFIRFLNAIEAEVPAGKAVHVFPDNYPAQKHPKVRQWLTRHERFTFHFTPTSCSWVNAVEGFFVKLTKRRLRLGVFHSVADLQAAINRFLDQHNGEARPFNGPPTPTKSSPQSNAGTKR